MKVRIGLAIGGVALIAFGLVIGFGWFSSSYANTTNEVRESIRTVTLDNESGAVTIRAADTETTTVRQRFEYRWNEPETGYTVEDDVLTLGDCGTNCTVDYEITVPRDVALNGQLTSGSVLAGGLRSAEVDVQSGDVQISDVTGPVSLSADSGTIAVSRISGELDLEASSGDITGSELNGPVRANVTSGRVQLGMATPQDVQAELSSGDVQLTVPPGSYAVRSNTSSGNTDVRVPNDPNAEHSLDLRTSSGSIVAHTR